MIRSAVDAVRSPPLLGVLPGDTVCAWMPGRGGGCRGCLPIRPAAAASVHSCPQRDPMPPWLPWPQWMGPPWPHWAPIRPRTSHALASTHDPGTPAGPPASHPQAHLPLSLRNPGTLLKGCLAPCGGPPTPSHSGFVKAARGPQPTGTHERPLSAPDNGALLDPAKGPVHPQATASSAEPRPAWGIDDSAQLYSIRGWGHPYFDVTPDGHILVRPRGEGEGGGGEEGEGDRSGTSRAGIKLVELVEHLKGVHGLQLPLIARFPQIMQHRLKELQQCFGRAMKRYHYQGSYEGVFPVKCNHDRWLLHTILDYAAAAASRFGLEAGSKPELLIAMSALAPYPGSLLVCNGYKDREYVETLLAARRLGIEAVVVLEQIDELWLVLEASRRTGVQPVIGARAKLSTRAPGHWEDTSGERGKFGLTPCQLVDVVCTLKQHGMLHCFRLLHFHFGSQIACIAVIKEAMREGTNMYCELALLGAPMGRIDVGGGLGVDYDGSRSSHESSLNYSMQNYANDVVAAVMDACVLKGVPQPIITTESGRALASHQSVLVFDVLSSSSSSETDTLRRLHMLSGHAQGVPTAAFTAPPPSDPAGSPALAADRSTDAVDGAMPFSGQAHCGSATEAPSRGSRIGSLPVHPVLHGGAATGSLDPLTLRRPEVAGPERGALPAGDYLLETFKEVYDSTGADNCQEVLNDARQLKAEATSLFKLGCLSLIQLATAHTLYQAVCHRVLSECSSSLPSLSSSLPPSPPPSSLLSHSELSLLRLSLSSVYHSNFSLFRALPDSWAIQQLFPIIPISRLNEQPTVEATLSDLTCDSDGKVCRFIGGQHSDGQANPSLLLHCLRPGEPYYLGVFLAGVYQEAMGSTHNLFGALNVAYVSTPESSTPSNPPFIIDHIEPGQSMQDVLGSAQYDGAEMLRTVAASADIAVAQGTLSADAARQLLHSFKASLSSYTYLSP